MAILIVDAAEGSIADNLLIGRELNASLDNNSFWGEYVSFKGNSVVL